MAGKNYTDALLTQVAKGWRPLTHINEIICPSLKVVKPTAKIGVYGADNLRIVSSVKAAAGSTPTVSFNVSQEDSYTLEEHALKAMAADKDAENQEEPFNEQRDKTEFLMDLHSVGREASLATWMANTGNITNNTTLSGTSQWGGSADDPISNINTGIAKVSDEIGMPAEMQTIILPGKVYRKLISLPEIYNVAGFQYNQTGQIKPNQLAAYFGVKQVLVPEGIYNSALEGQTDSLAQIWGKHAWILYVPAAPKLKELAFGYTCRRTMGPVVDKWRDEDVRGWWVRATDEWDQFIMYQKAAYLIKDAIA